MQLTWKEQCGAIADLKKDCVSWEGHIVPGKVGEVQIAQGFSDGGVRIVRVKGFKQAVAALGYCLFKNDVYLLICKYALI